MHSFLGVPIVGRRGAFGNLYLTEKLGAAVFTDEDEHIAVLLAATAAAIVENARLHEESARLLEEVQELHRTRERFFAMVNHELRNALAAVFGWAEMLVRKKDPATVPRAAFEVLDSAEQAIGLINDLLDLSRLDEDRLKPVIRAVDPGAIARRALGRVTPAAEAKQVRLELKLLPALPSCETDASRVEQILVNLLGNAIHHTPRGHVRSTCGSVPIAGRVVLHRLGRGSGNSGERGGADLRHLRHQGRRRRAAEPAWDCRSHAAWPACSGGSFGRCAASDGGGGRFVLELPALTGS